MNKMNRMLAPFMKENAIIPKDGVAARIAVPTEHQSRLERVARREAKFANMAAQQAHIAELGQLTVNPKVNHCPAMW